MYRTRPNLSNLVTESWQTPEYWGWIVCCHESAEVFTVNTSNSLLLRLIECSP